MSFKSFLLCSLIAFLFLILPFSFPVTAFAQSITPTNTGTTTISDTGTTDASTTEPNWWDKFWSWLTGVFISTDYTIAQRPSKNINSDMTNYGNVDDSDKHSSSGTRLTSSSSQKCYKGSVIKKVILGTSGYPDSDLSYICSDSSNPNNCIVSSDSTCKKIKITDLAHYFVQIQQQFYCDDQNNLINIENDVITKTNEKFTDLIPESEKSCYQTIYNDFYLVPKETDDKEEENSKKIVKTPISANEQVSGNSVKENKSQLDKNFSPAGTSGGLNGLRPSGW